jgi:hypothetical protein
MPWMRAAIGMGVAGLVAGVAGMSLWIDDGSHYFELAAALASAGLLTLVSCVLTRVFGSSHGSQDDAFSRGRSMGYDAGFLEGHRTARPVVVPLRAVDRDVDDEQVPFEAANHPDQSNTTPLSGRDSKESAGVRVLAWGRASRTPLLAGALCLALVGAVFAGALLRKPEQASALKLPLGDLIYRAVSPSGATPALVTGVTPSRAPGPGSVVAGAAPAAPAVAAGSPVAGGSGVAAAPAAGSVGAPSGVAAMVPAAFANQPAVAGPVSAPAIVYQAPVAAAPVVPLTPAQQTAADAAAAAALTAANAKAAADRTARDAAAAAALTKANADAAAAATAKAAADAAWAVAHPTP